MKSAFFVIIFLVTFYSNAWAQAPKHYVFLIHGIGATPATFGPMKDALAREAQGFDSHTDWQFTSFAYDTGNDHKDIVDFSLELGDFIINKFNENGGLNPGDKFSLIMHSQGGLIGLNLLLNSYKENPRYHPELKNHLDAFITLGTPYWGAKIAIFADRMMPILNYLKLSLSNKWGDEELRDMELASDFSGNLRQELTTPENIEILEAIKHQGRFLVFSGAMEKLNFLAPLAAGRGDYEDDTAVPIPSSRLDFIYYADREFHHDYVGASEFKQTHMIDNDHYIVVSAFHSSPFPQKPGYPGIAKLPDRCANISYRDCDHPTYPRLVEHLFNIERTPSAVRKLTSFSIDLKLKYHGLPVDKKHMSIKFKSMTSGLYIGIDTELYNNVSRWSSEGDFRLYHTGTMSSSSGEVELTIKNRGFKDRVVVVPVKTAISSFVELDIEKK